MVGVLAGLGTKRVRFSVTRMDVNQGLWRESPVNDPNPGLDFSHSLYYCTSVSYVDIYAILSV